MGINMEQKMDATAVIYIIFTCLLMVQTVHASWWYLGLSGSSYQGMIISRKLNFRSKCSKISVLVPRQRELCTRSRNILGVVTKGASIGIDECQYQFRDRRWNCTTFNNTSVFGRVLKLRSREKAYIYAVSSAGVMHTLVRACAKGELGICDCDPNIRLRDTKNKFIWGGCSHNVRFGDKFTSEFVDSKESAVIPDGLMNLWNNAAGRKAVKQNMKILCKCHGVSGSCSVRICWRTMASFREIGSHLKNKFDGASQVKMHKKRQKLTPVSKIQKKPTRKDLVYLQESPDYCEFNPSIGSLGTRGRSCNKTSYGLEGCALMCCGRGYHTIVKEIREDCDCKFFWCCRVECKKCQKKVERHYCN